MDFYITKIHEEFQIDNIGMQTRENPNPERTIIQIQILVKWFAFEILVDSTIKYTHECRNPYFSCFAAVSAVVM